MVELVPQLLRQELADLAAIGKRRDGRSQWMVNLKAFNL